ncbi:uncharacterized protein LOC143036299 [Oratosquilla oratoria]|uniref:uncharacterized protein LOC143036299 n=1 Tax=Oratosquilla oratoria TaxID=337810 RepID=UPI003F76324E
MRNWTWAQSSVTAPPTPSASACVRFKVYFFRPLTHVFSLTSREESREINGEIFVDYVRPIVSAAFYFLGISEPLQVLTWYHYCLTYDHTKAQISAYLDGVLQGVISRNISRNFAEATLVLGQYSLEYLSSYSRTRSFSGEITHAGVWGRTLTAEEVSQLAACGPNPPGVVIPWMHDWILNNATFIEVPEEEVCTKKTTSQYIKFKRITYHNIRSACRGLGGVMPVPRDLEHALELKALLAEDPPIPMFWIGANDELQEGTYVSDHTGEVLTWFQWGSNDPNGLQWQNCLMLDETLMHDYPCHITRNGVCFLQAQLEWTLRGPCEEDTANYKFSLLHPGLGQLLFRGYYQYEVRFSDAEGAWLWRNVLTNTTIARLQSEEGLWPMGRHNWTVEGEVCGKGGVQVLQLSSCVRDQFTCRDGSCIPRIQRCDQRPDCFDESDEQECQLVYTPTGYHHSLPPPSAVPGTPLPVGLKIRIVSLSLSDKTSNLEVTYHLNMTWFDLRLSYHNLKAESRLNQVPVARQGNLWTPTLTLVNVRGTERTQVDAEAILTIHRWGHSLPDDLSSPEDADVYVGEENPVSVERKYTTEFLCDMQLELYPFDVQHCYMDMQVLSAATDFVVLREDVSEVLYEGGELLIEYIVVSVNLKVMNEHTLAEAVVEVILQRRVGYPIISIYVPTIILLILAYLSLVFRRDNFEARVMSALTVLLVLAALFTQTSNSLPKTSYFKMVDVWLLFSISLIFFVIVFHVIIDMAHDGKLLMHSKVSSSPIQVVSPAEKLESPGATPLESRNSGTGGFASWIGFQGEASGTSKNKALSDRLFRYALLFVPGYFVVFNIIYWCYIFI